jgi:UDP-glucose 4-epimerase
MKKRIAVSGAMGFIGGYVVEQLIRSGYTPVLLDRHKRHDRFPEHEFFLGDVNDEPSMFELAAHVDGFVHLAAQLGTQETINNPRPVFQTNLMGGLNILEACRRYNTPIVNICVGNYWMNNPYSISKNMFERTLDMYRKEHNLAGANVRCVNAYGPRQSAAPPFASGTGVRKVMPALICRALCGMPVEIYGDGTQVSDCVYVDDVARTLVATMFAILSENRPVSTLQVGPPTSSTINETAEMVIELVSQKTGVRSAIEHLPMRPGEEEGAKVVADVDTLAQVGIDPGSFVGLEDGIDRTIDYFIEHEGITWSRP